MSYKEHYKKMLFNARMAELYTEAAERERRCGDYNNLAADFDRFAATARKMVSRGACKCAITIMNNKTFAA